MTADAPVPPVPSEAAARIVEGTHDDPFAILGPHEIDGILHVTAFDPGATALAARIDGADHPLAPQGDGVFRGPVPSRDYRLAGTNGDAAWEADDPFRFGPVLGEVDEYLISEGSHRRLWHVLGAKPMEHEGVQGTRFAVWAPSARRVAVVGGWNLWDPRRGGMRRRGVTGVWEVFVPGVGEGTFYKYAITGPDGTAQPLKADPVGFGAEHPPEQASVVRDLSGHDWADGDWMGVRADRQARTAPISVYEVHLGSWRRPYGRRMSYLEAASDLVDYVADMGFTHIELMPISEYPFDGSWGYQPVGLYAPTIRYGTPNELRAFVEAAHARGIGLLLDWVPGHFPTDPHGLALFDGTHLYEHADPKEGFHQDWNTLIYNYGRAEVRNYLQANALYWLEEYHLDGLRVDAVASMLYRDYSRQEGEWIPNKDGGRENYEAIGFLQGTNVMAYGEVPGIMTVAEESTSYPQVSGRVDAGGLGFGYKWNMGWMNDTLDYMSREPIHRRHHHHQMTFGLHYAFSENFILPISHDEVVHGKGSMIRKMPGERWEKFANLRAYFGFMWGHPGKKLLFMGQEFGQWAEWDHDAELDWGALDDPLHGGLKRLVRDLNTLYRGTPSLHVRDCEAEGFDWIVGDDTANSVFAWVRRGAEGDPPVVVVCNMTPVERTGYALGLPQGGAWREVMNTDADLYGGGNRGNMGRVEAVGEGRHAQPAHAVLTLPPLSTVMLMPVGE
ncbi:1,4-alpha-glucan branching protein GlgB [Jannaschia sp. Os4]|uniref:1,4-alpha-glucan branching protein GlgB n=1 Tax=Jannaschia sp. Os4 TaxID=2807617 RepID=UPI00193A6CA5|nr:1,4-alpha-glucan branching protein GlgB [Jannaschia sp. Os4]MBM2575584.1 1,4-alpha-glucan branching protein GlgB [Jannaschia sp. Os4]